jgi:DNA-damage-inducible protein D
MTNDFPESQVSHFSPFESIRRIAQDGSEYWSARDLSKILRYTQYNKFAKAIAKAEEACENSGQNVTNHFIPASEIIVTGNGAKRQVDTLFLSRYACYLLVQKADPSKPAVALGQTYFAVQTRRQELKGRDEFVANLFCASQTKQKVEREEIRGRDNVNRTHDEIRLKLRQFIQEMGGVLPEDLPTHKESF